MFSGLAAPKHLGEIPSLPDWVAQEAFSHELSSCGFWLGNNIYPDAAFYSYCYSEPEGYKTAVHKSTYPKHTLFEFLHSCFREGATLANWDRRLL